MAETIGKMGDRLWKCRTCATFVVLAPDAETPVDTPVEKVVHPMFVMPAVKVFTTPVAQVETPVDTPVDTAAASRYRCGAHPAQHVSWRGTGCPECAVDHRRWLAARAERRRDAAVHRARTTRTTTNTH